RTATSEGESSVFACTRIGRSDMRNASARSARSTSGRARPRGTSSAPMTRNGMARARLASTRTRTARGNGFIWSPSGASLARAEPPLDDQYRGEDRGDDKYFPETAARDRGLEHEEEQRHGHEDADDDLEREATAQERIRRSAHATGSYVPVTTRSLSGMIAL